MPVTAINNGVSVSIAADQTTLTVGELAPGTIFRLFETEQGRGAHSASGRLFVKSGNGRGVNGKLLKRRYNGDEAPIAIALPMSADDSRAWTPATKVMTPDTPVLETFGVLTVNF